MNESITINQEEEEKDMLYFEIPRPANIVAVHKDDTEEIARMHAFLEEVRKSCPICKRPIEVKE